MNNDDMSNLFNQFSKAVSEGNIPDEMKNILSSFNSNNSNSTNENEDINNTIDIETIMKMKSAMEKMNSTDDPRSNLLRSLKPYLKESRQSKVDEYIKLFGMSKVMEIFKDFGGDKK